MPRDTDAIVSRAIGIAAAAALAGSASVLAGGAQPLSIGVTPRVIRMTTFAGGSEVRVDGQVAADARAVVVITGAAVDETLNRKRRIGLVWLNSGKVEVSGVPSLFLLLSPAALGDLLAPQELVRAGIDEASLKRRMRVRPTDADTAAVRDSYVALKAEEGKYQFVFDAVRPDRQAGRGAGAYVASLQWPRTAPPGTYRATVYECRNRVVMRTASTMFEVTRSGVAAVLRATADDHAMVYGAMAVLVMMVLGFGIDFTVARVRRLRARPTGRPPHKVAREDVAVH